MGREKSNNFGGGHSALDTEESSLLLGMSRNSPQSLPCPTGVPFPSWPGCGVVRTKEVRTMKAPGSLVTHLAVKDTTTFWITQLRACWGGGSKGAPGPVVCLDFPHSPHALTPGG